MLAIGNDQRRAQQPENTTRGPYGGAFFRMPIVGQENYGSRKKHADKVDQRSLPGADLLLNNSTDPEKQPDIQKQVQPIEMEKRIGRDAPEFTAELTIVRERAELQKRDIISNAVRCDLDSKTNRYGENQDKRSPILESARPARIDNDPPITYDSVDWRRPERERRGWNQRGKCMRSGRLLFALLLCSAGAFAQTATGTITGTISDPAGAVVPNAPIEARNAATGKVYGAASTATGNANGARNGQIVARFRF